MPPLWNCDWAGCKSSAVQRTGDCEICQKHLCRKHLLREWHTCPTPENNWKDFNDQYGAAESRVLLDLCQRIRGDQLCRRASELRRDNGSSLLPCKIDLSPERLSSMMGAQNCHADIVFEDGIVWIARFRLSGPKAPPPAVRDYILQSEAATMLFMQSQTKIPSPLLFDWACESDPTNEVGVGYLLMEKVKGTPLNWPGATKIQKEKIVRQLADVMLEIERHPFHHTGSLMPMPADSLMPTAMAYKDKVKVQHHAKHSTFYSGDSGQPLGPFSSSYEAMMAEIKAYLKMIATGEIGVASHLVDVFLDHRFRLDILNRLFRDPATSPTGISERFYLKHPDDKGDHILVNSNFDVVGIIDWEWCTVVSREEAFSSPCMMWPVSAFYDGSNELTDEELHLAQVFRDQGRDDLARLVLNGRKVQRLMFALGPVAASHEDPKTRAALFMGMKRAFDLESRPDPGVAPPTELEEWEVWKGEALTRWKDDEQLQHLLEI